MHCRTSARSLSRCASTCHCHVDLRDAGRTDELADTANYGDVTERVADAVRESKDVLLERLAERVAEVAVGFDRVEGVEVTVTKVRPPIPEVIETTAVRIQRRRADFDQNTRDLAHRDRRAGVQPRRPRALPAAGGRQAR